MTYRDELKRLRTALKKAKSDKLVSIAYNIASDIKKLQFDQGRNDPKPKKPPKIKVKKKSKVLSIKRLMEKRKTERLLIKEETRLEKKLISDADYRFAKFIRKRDEHKDCVTGDIETCEHVIQNCCHRISRGRYSHRRDEDNCAGGCVSCNKYHAQDHGASRERKEIRESGIEWVDYQNVVKNKKKPSIDELMGILEKYKEKYHNLIASD